MVYVRQDEFGCAINPFTYLPEKILRFTVTNCNNMCFQVITLGATITTLFVPDKYGKLDDIMLGFDDVEGYQTETNPYIGCTVGRVCSRVGNGRFKLDGKTYTVSRNLKKKHMLHGGYQGFSKLHWRLACIHADGVTLMVCSPDGHEGFPGVVNAMVHFTLTEDNCFKTVFEARCSKPTPINLCNHAYFNLAGHNAGRKALYEHFAWIKSYRITEKDDDTVPTGRYLEVEGTPYDCREWKNIGEGIKQMKPEPGYDDNYCLTLDLKKLYTTVAKVFHPHSGRMMHILTDQPAMHFYTSHNMPDLECGEKPTIFGKCGAKYGKHCAFCMETSGYPDAMNHPQFPSVVLRPGEKYTHTCIFKFTVANACMCDICN